MDSCDMTCPVPMDARSCQHRLQSSREDEISEARNDCIPPSYESKYQHNTHRSTGHDSRIDSAAANVTVCDISSKTVLYLGRESHHDGYQVQCLSIRTLNRPRQ
jgi:hypothetical protein